MNPSKKNKPNIKGTEVESAENVRMNINLTKAFYKRIKQRALDEDRTVKELVIQAIEKYLDKQK